jgi:putative NIF3 family GTP cyclohydrolase 1 type 2
MKDPRYQKLAEQVVGYAVRVQPGERVNLRMLDIPDAMVVELIRAVRQAGGIPHVDISHAAINRELQKGATEEQYELEDFVYKIKQALGADSIRYADACNPVQRIAVVGGDGKGYVSAAIAEGADTYISGRIGYNVMEEAAEMGINLIEAGHYYTEQHICEFFRELLVDFDPNLYVEISDSNMIRTIS